jgi:Mg2+ and Co2+ transporter CorA
MPDEKLIPVQDHPNLKRDPYSGAVIDVDTTAYERYQLQKQLKQQQESRITHLEDTINTMVSDVSDIKNLLTRLLEK